jgi:hypothetical protein
MKYHLIPYRIGKEGESFKAMAHASHHYDLKELADYIDKQSQGVSAAEVLAVFQALQDTIPQLLKSGGTINTPIFNASLAIAGVFTDPKEKFDAAKHEVRVSLAVGKALKKGLEQVKVERTNAPSNKASISEVLDMFTDTANTRITPGQLLMIYGYRLKFDASQKDEGLFLFNRQTGQHVQIAQVPLISNKRIYAMMPAALAPGAWELEIRVRPRNNSSISSTVFEHTLSVE